jgi:hypothetical protein
MGYICCQDYRNFLFSCLWFFFLIQCLTMLLENSIQITHIGVMIVSNWLALYKTCKSHVYCDNFVSKDNKMNCELMLTYDTPALRQTGSRNLTGQKTLPTIWGTYMKLVTTYQISAINSCWEKCDKKCAYMFNVYKNQLSWQTGSRNLTGPKTLPTLWYTYMTLVTKYQISAINSYWEKCDEKYLGRTEGQTDRGKTVCPLPLRGARV